jgi:hypothetical protein
MVDGRPRYVTALGETDEPAGWRANKARGGILMDVDSGEVITRGLSMPHSPRWYGGRLWVCESGAGTFGYIDPNSGRYVPIAEVPGFTRGLDFAGNLAFVGLSQVRESAVFSGIAITERLTEEERTCGVCVQVNNPSGTAPGGGIDCEKSTLSMTNDTVNANQANGQNAYGVGIYALGSTVDVENSTVNGNQANGSVDGEGGGIYAFETNLTLGVPPR